MVKFEKVYYLETADGDVMRVPEKKLQYFRKNQNNKKKPYHKEVRAALRRRISRIWLPLKKLYQTLKKASRDI